MSTTALDLSAALFPVLFVAVVWMSMPRTRGSHLFLALAAVTHLVGLGQRVAMQAVLDLVALRQPVPPWQIDALRGGLPALTLIGSAAVVLAAWLVLARWPTTVEEPG
ncbi:MAG: hypothetical protein EP330_20380 [Deltaproteobacteria bacterium]|nr:MAG: hypothetical protein EP330_20380 [Deltaproteobacteria bacterium]